MTTHPDNPQLAKPPKVSKAPPESTPCKGNGTFRRPLSGLVIAYFVVVIPWAITLATMVILRAPTAEAGAANITNLRWYWILSAALWGVLTAILLLLRQRQEPVSKQIFRRAIGFIIISGLVLRVVIAITHSPGLSDDIWRYVFDGAVLNAGHNPYQLAPAAVSADEPRFSGEYALAEQLNNREMVTIYLPVSQTIFFVSVKLHEWVDPATTADGALDADRAVITLRLILIAFDVGILLLLAMLLHRFKKHPFYLALYAWHPLVLSEFAGEGHQDVIGIFLMLSALTLWQFRKQAVIRWTALLALSALVKPLSIPIAGFALLHQKANRRQWGVSLIVGAVLMLGILLPFLYWPNTEVASGYYATLDRFGHKWAFHGSIFQPIFEFVERHNLAEKFCRWPLDRFCEDAGDLARLICLAFLSIICVVLLIRRVEPFKAARIFLFAALLLSPTAWAWYLLWAFVIFPLRPSAALWVASLTIPWGYAVLGNVVDWTTPAWLVWATYAPIYLTLIVDVSANFWRSRNRGDCNE